MEKCLEKWIAKFHPETPRALGDLPFVREEMVFHKQSYFNGRHDRAAANTMIEAETQARSNGANTSLSNRLFAQKVPEFFPCLDEMADFSAFVNKVVSNLVGSVPMFKVIPPNEWKPRQDLGYNLTGIYIKNASTQTINEQQQPGFYTVFNNRLAEKSRSSRFSANSFREKYEKEGRDDPRNLLECASRVYGSDSDGSLFDDGCRHFNLNNLATPLDQLNPPIPGVSTPFLYFGTKGSMFALHTEDCNLFSVSYLHTGNEKWWIGIPPAHGQKAEELGRANFAAELTNCAGFLSHKCCFISPDALESNRIPYYETLHGPREFIITLPYAYHQGVNTGYNIAEAVNFIGKGWKKHAKVACRCRGQGTVDINPDDFDEI